MANIPLVYLHKRRKWRLDHGFKIELLRFRNQALGALAFSVLEMAWWARRMTGWAQPPQASVGGESNLQEHLLRLVVQVKCVCVSRVGSQAHAAGDATPVWIWGLRIVYQPSQGPSWLSDTVG